MGTVVLDASVLLAALDPDDAHHQAAAAALVAHHEQRRPMVVPASVLSEVLVAEARRGRPAVDQRRQLITRLFGTTRPIDDDVAVAAATLRAEHRAIRLPDALVIATGQVDDAEVMLTANKRWSGVDQRIQVIKSP